MIDPKVGETKDANESIQKSTKNKSIFIQKQMTPSFLGISNWDIDASKLNRNVYLARPDLEMEDLEETAKIIINYQIKDQEIQNNIKDQVEQLSEILSNCYLKFRNDQVVGSVTSLIKGKF